MDNITSLIGNIITRVLDIRHDIHQHPEVGLTEHRTAGVIEGFLDEIGVAHERCTETGVVAHIGSSGGRVVALRADMDALAMPENSGQQHASVNDGVAHACGHDGHVAMLLGTAWVLKQVEDKLNGMVKLIFQPDEEGGTGAKKMVDAGVLESPRPDVIFALHDWPGFPVGTVGYRFGPVLASVNSMKIVVKGKGTHGALPHAGIDPVTISARIIDGLQLIRSRMIDPLDPIVISVCTIHGGSAVNVIPDEVILGGTIRTVKPETQTRVLELIELMAVDTARASGGDATVTFPGSFPPTVNDDKATAFARDVIADNLGKDHAHEVTTTSMGGEDFSHYLKQIPGTFLLLGVGDRVALHNPAFDFNDEAIPAGIRVMTEMVVKFLDNGFG
ncbi:M20 family metallopeptidase [Candidatus Latescibacterota bacterium]